MAMDTPLEPADAAEYWLKACVCEEPAVQVPELKYAWVVTNMSGA
jgi:hypothetical protein